MEMCSDTATWWTKLGILREVHEDIGDQRNKWMWFTTCGVGGGVNRTIKYEVEAQRGGLTG